MKQLIPLIICTIVVSYFALPAHGQSSRTIDLQEAVNIALENNRDIRISGYDVETAESIVKEITGGFFPEVSISSQYTRNVKKPVLFLGDGMSFPGAEGASSIEIGSNNSYMAGLNASVPLYSRQLLKSRKAATKGRELSKVDLQETKNRVTADVKNAFYTILLTQEVVRVTQIRIENAEKQLEDVQRLEAEGLATEYDVLVAEVELENLRPELIQAEDDLENAELRLKNIMGVVEEESISVSGELRPANVESIEHRTEQLLRNVYSNNYQLRLLDSQIDLSRTNIEIEEASLYPTISAFGNYQYQSEDDTFNFGDYDWVNTAAVGLSVQIPIFSGNSRRERISQAQIGARQAEEQRTAAEEALYTEFKSVTNRLEQIINRIEASERAIQQAQRAYQLSLMRFEQGLGTQLEINNSELAYATSQFNQLQAYYDYQLTMIALDQLQGRLLANN